MAFPFAQWQTADEFITALRERFEVTVDSQPTHGPRGKTDLPVLVRIEANKDLTEPKVYVAVLPETAPDQRLDPLVVGSVLRRLGIDVFEFYEDFDDGLPDGLDS